MRFCPFCSAENAIEATHCKTCARRLPPLPPRRRKPTRSVGLEPADSTDEPVDSTATTSPGAGDAAGTKAAAVPRSLLSKMGPAPTPASLRREQAVEPRREQPAEPQHEQPAEPRHEQPAEPRHEQAEAEPRHEQPAEPRHEQPEAAPRHEQAEGELRPPGAPARRKTDRRAPLPDESAAEAPPDESRGDEFGPDESRGDEFDASRSPARRADSRADEWPAPERPELAPAPNDENAGGEDAQPVQYPQAAGYSEAGGYPVYSRPEGAGDHAAPQRAFTQSEVVPIPEVPEAGAVNAVRYALAVTRARWQRRDAIKSLNDALEKDRMALDQVFGALGKQAWAMNLDDPALATDRSAVDQAEEHRKQIELTCSTLNEKRVQEDSSFTGVESEYQAKVGDIEAQLQSAQNELGNLYAQQRGLRDKQKNLERQKRGYLKAADERMAQAGQSAVSEARAGLRQAAEDLHREAKALEPEMHEVESRLSALERPIAQELAHVEALQSQLDATRRNHEDERDGHRHRLAEIEAELSRKSLELSQAEAELQRRFVALGMLANAHRTDRPEIAEIYARIDTLQGAINARSAESQRLTAESEAYDRTSRTRGFLILGGVAAVILLIIILIALV